jgi:hypothetical protein
MAIQSWYEAMLKSFFTQQILRNYALTINGAVKIQPQDLRINQLVIMNNSSNPIYLGADSSVSVSNGFPILPNEAVTFICDSSFVCYLYGNNQEVRILELL